MESGWLIQLRFVVLLLCIDKFSREWYLLSFVNSSQIGEYFGGHLERVLRRSYLYSCVYVYQRSFIEISNGNIWNTISC